MKRLKVYTFLTVLLLSVVGGIFSPIKAHAAVSKVQFDAIRQQHFDNEIAAFYDLKTGVMAAELLSLGLANYSAVPSDLQALILSKVQASGDAIYANTVSTNPNITIAEATVALLTQWEKDLSSIDQTKGSSFLGITISRGSDVVLQRMISSISAAKQLAQNTVLVQAGQKTAAQAALDNAKIAAGQTSAINSTLPSANPDPCSLLEGDLLQCADQVVTWFIKSVLLKIAGFLLWLAANIFNYAVQIGILNFSKWAPDTLYPIWLIIRQIASLIIVFIGLYLGLMYILGKDEKFQRYIPWVVIFALFVNFSYPLVRTAIDISNIVSLNLYASTVGAKALDASFSSQDTAGYLIMQRLGLQEIINSGARQVETSVSIVSDLKSTPSALMAVAFVLYAAYIFFIVAGIMVMRTASLVFLIVASPLLLIDSVLPMLGDRAKSLRKIFFEQLAVGPVFMVMLALTLKFLEVFSSVSPNGAAGPLSASGGLAGDQTIKTFFNLAIMLVMLHIMIKVTKSTAGEIGTYGSNFMGKVGGFGLGVAAGGTGLLARKGLGGLAAKARDSKWVTNNQDSFIGRRAYNLSNSVANSTFDVRNTSVAGKMAGIGMGMGMGAKMGYDEENKKRTDDLLKRASRIKTRHERDVIENGVVVARKGDVNKEGVAALERFQKNKGGALFQTKKQQQELAASYIDDASSSEMTEYNKLHTKAQKSDFKNTLTTQLEQLKKVDGNNPSPKAQALMRTLFDIKKKEKEEMDAFELQLQKEIDRYNRTPPAERAKFLARLDTETSDAVKSSIGPGDVAVYNPNRKSSTSTTSTTSATSPSASTSATQTSNQPLTGQALRQERIQKVAEGRATQMEDAQSDADAQFHGLKDSTEEIRKINEKYDKEIQELTDNAPDSLILDARGVPIKNKPSQAQIDAVNKRRSEDLEPAKMWNNIDKQLVDESKIKLTQVRDKQETSRAKAEVFSGNRTERGGATVDVDVTQPSSVDIDITQPYNVEKVATQSFAEKAAATRAAKQAKAAQAANTQMNQNATRPIPQAPVTPTTPSNPPVTPPVTV